MPDVAKPVRPPVAARPAAGCPVLAGRRSSTAGVPALLSLGYAALGYVVFLAVLGYAVGFFIGLGVPKGIDQGPRIAVPLAVAIDAALLFWLWRPVGGTVWNLSGPAAGLLLAGYAARWAVAVSSIFLISHSDLFGLRQAYLHARHVRYRPPPFTERGLYRRIRHPLMAGFVIIFWATPTMTAWHLLFAVAATGYILVGISFEERDLKRSLGETYSSYMTRIPALIPALRPRSHA